MDTETSNNQAKAQLNRIVSDEAWERRQVSDRQATMASNALGLALGRQRLEYDDMGRPVHVPIAEVLADADALLAWMAKANAA